MTGNVGGVVQTGQNSEGAQNMTGLGAALYGGFFAVAALWLLFTSDEPASGQPADCPEPLNSANTCAACAGQSSLN